ncbi:serine hydrolase [Clostridium sp. JNZ J1-5]
MRKIVNFIIIFVVTFSLFSYKTEAKSSLSAISADGIVLMDATTGEILYSKNMDTQYPPASTTKIMTALLTLENCKLDDVITVGKNPPNADGSKIYLFQGESIKVKDLLYALMLQSANDAAEALAEHISGSTTEFAKLMNKRAIELGATNTNFVNPHGLYDENHRTTAKDLALILKELAKHKEFKEIATTSMYYIEPTNKSPEKRPLWNKNNLIQKKSKYYYEGSEGGKTGYTVQSKHSYVAIASRNNQKLIAVLLHDTKHTYWTDVRVLFDYGFQNFTLKPLYLKGDPVEKFTIDDNSSIPLLAGEDFYYVAQKNSTELPKVTINNKPLDRKSFSRGENILTATVTYKDKNIGTLNLASSVDHSSKNLLPSLSGKSGNKSMSTVKVALYILITLFIILFLLRLRKKRLMKKRHKRNKIIKDYRERYKDEE